MREIPTHPAILLCLQAILILRDDAQIARVHFIVNIETRTNHHCCLCGECATIVNNILAHRFLFNSIMVFDPIHEDRILRDDTVHFRPDHVIHICLCGQRVDDVFLELMRDEERFDYFCFARADLRRLEQYLKRGKVIEKVDDKIVFLELK